MGGNAGIMYRCMDVQEISGGEAMGEWLRGGIMWSLTKKPAGYPTGLIGKMQLEVLFII